MTVMTSAFANKVLRKLNEEKIFWISKENEGCTYDASADEEAVIPDYDYEKVSSIIEDIDNKVVIIKHAINLVNTTNSVQVGDRKMTIDEILIRMAQLNRRKSTLNSMRVREPKTRISSSSYYSQHKAVPEYRYINYDLDLIKQEYERVDSEISEMQLQLDKFNQTFEFQVDIDI